MNEDDLDQVAAEMETAMGPLANVMSPYGNKQALKGLFLQAVQFMGDDGHNYLVDAWKSAEIEAESDTIHWREVNMHVEEGVVIEGQFKDHPVETIFKDGEIVEMSIMPMRTGGKTQVLRYYADSMLSEWQREKLAKAKRKRENRHSSPAEVQRKKRREKRAQRRKSH